MKKIFLTLCAVALLLAVFAVSVFSEKQETVHIADLPVTNIDGFLVKEPENLGELEAWSHYIVKGVLSDDAVNHEPVYDDPEYGDINGYTISTLTILESYKGDLKAGDTVPFAEAYCIREGKNRGPYLLTYLGYKPLAPGQEYILFMCPQDDSEEQNAPWSGSYGPTYSVRSRYQIPSSKGRSAEVEKLAFDNAREEEIYSRIAKQVQEKYK